MNNGLDFPISCYIRTLNEEACIERTIRAAFGVAQEVVIVDSGSKDKTVEIATAAGARVVHQQWLGNGFQKRVGEEACTHDWVLDLDADEILTPELISEIRTCLAQGGPRFDVYEFSLVTAPPIGKPWYDFLVVTRYKLYDRRKLRMPESKSWDQLELPQGVPYGVFKQVILHYSFRNFAHIVEKLNGVSTRRVTFGTSANIHSVRLRVLFGLPFYFFKAYIMKGLWRAGLYGFIMARLSANGRWLRDAKRYEAYLTKINSRQND